MVPWLWGLNNLTKLPDFEIYICYRDFQCSYTTHTIWPLSTILLHCYMTTVHLLVVCRWYLVSRELQDYVYSVHYIAHSSNMIFSWCSRALLHTWDSRTCRLNYQSCSGRNEQQVFRESQSNLETWKHGRLTLIKEIEECAAQWWQSPSFHWGRVFCPRIVGFI